MDNQIRLNPQHIYLAENGRRIYVWIGSEVPGEMVVAVFGFNCALLPQPQKPAHLPELSTPLSKRLHHVISRMRQRCTHRFLPIEIIFQKDTIEASFRESILFEDKTIAELSYVDFVKYVQQEIQKSL